MNEFNETGHKNTATYKIALEEAIKAGFFSAQNQNQTGLTVRLNNKIPDKGRPKSIPRMCVG